MADRYDAVAVRKYEDRDGNEKSAFTNIGVAFPMKDRDGYSLRLHCLPAPVDGEYSILLFPPKPREDQHQDRRQENRRDNRSSSYDRDDSRTHGGGGYVRDLDDEIPFAPEWR